MLKQQHARHCLAIRNRGAQISVFIRTERASTVPLSQPSALQNERIPMPHRDVVFPAGRQALYERNRYSPAVRANGFLFVSGQVGSREDGSPEPDLAARVRLAFTNLNAVLHAAGCTFDDVVDVTMFVVNPEANFATVWGIVPEFWGEAPHPTLTGIGVTWLYGFQFEIKVIVKLPDSRG